MQFVDGIAVVESLRELQLEEKKILDKTVSVINKLGLRYYIGYGTLLGAVRHKGFIPWDDDLDILMPRPDYERFIASAAPMLGEELVLMTYKSERAEIGHIARIVNKNVRYYSRAGGKIRKSNVVIDIQIIDGAPDNIYAWKWHFFKLTFLNTLVRFSITLDTGVDPQKKYPLIKRAGIWLNKRFRLGKYISAKKVWRSIETLRKKYDYNGCKWVYPLIFAYGRDRIRCKREWFGEGCKLLFEGEEFIGPANYDAFLKCVYGDYLTLPPISERAPKYLITSANDIDGYILDV